MAAASYLDWPFFEPRHRQLAGSLNAWSQQHVADRHGADVDAMCRGRVLDLGQAGWLRYAVGGTAYGGASGAIDTRDLPDTRDPGAPQRACGLRFCDAGAGFRRNDAFRQRKAQAGSPGPRGGRHGNFGIRLVRTGSPVRRRCDGIHDDATEVQQMIIGRELLRESSIPLA